MIAWTYQKNHSSAELGKVTVGSVPFADLAKCSIQAVPIRGKWGKGIMWLIG